MPSMPRSAEERLIQTLCQLSPQERRCLYARHQGKTLRQIGDELGLDVRGVARMIDAVVARLQAAVAPKH